MTSQPTSLATTLNGTYTVSPEGVSTSWSSTPYSFFGANVTRTRPSGVSRRPPAKGWRLLRQALLCRVGHRDGGR